MNTKGTALIITLVYLIIVAVLCASILTFSVGHYELTSQRVDRSQGLYLAEGGLYYGLASGARGDITIDSKTVTISEASGKLKSSRSY